MNSNEIYSKLKELNILNNPLFSDADEITSGLLFSHVFDSLFLFNTTARSWMVYDGRRWIMDEEQKQAELHAARLQRVLVSYLYDNSPSPQSDNGKKFLTYAFSLASHSKRMKMLSDAEAFMRISSEEMDTQGELLNLENGVLDLNSLKILPHSPSFRMTKLANVSYMEEAASPRWEEFLSEIFQGDEGKISYIQRLFGYCLTSETKEEELYLFYGPTTRNGKSTCLETVSYLLGDYCVNMQPETLAQKDRNSRNASSDIVRLKSARVVHCSEAPKRMTFDSSLLKNLTGRDAVTARALYQSEVEFIPEFKIVLNTNYLPDIRDDSVFSSGRIKVILFPRHFTEDEQDKTLKEQLQKPESLSGILNWMITGLRRYREEGMKPPESVVKDTDAYRKESDKVGLFVEECFTVDPLRSISGKEGYLYYHLWCQQYGYYAENKEHFFQDLKGKNLLAKTGTVDGHTVHNVIRGLYITEKTKADLQGTRGTDDDIPP